MRVSLKKILKMLLYGFFLLATFLMAWITSGSRDTKLTGSSSLPSAPKAHADVPPVGSDTGSDAGCAGCAGSGDGSEGSGGSGGSEGSGDGGSGEGSGGGGAGGAGSSGGAAGEG